MGSINALQTARLSASVVESNLQKYVDLINSNIKPPVKLAPTDIFVRAMYIISDGVNSYGGRFDRADLPQIAGLFIDSPVLIGHDKSGLPVARNFWAETIEKGDQLWVKCYFYWLRGADGSSRLKANIDSGIYKECSVSFTYTCPECSACGKDIRFCGHQVTEDIFFYYRGVDKVLETSLVYRGSIPGTSITDKLSNINADTPKGEAGPGKIFTLNSIASLSAGIRPKNNRRQFKARIAERVFMLVSDEKD
jgi:hypothetical protein